MKDLKFRAWCKLDNKWLEPDQGNNDWPMLLAIGLHGLPICIDKDSIKQGEIVGWNRDHNIEIIQSTGIKDKNGVCIYQDDIAQKKGGRFCETGVVKLVHGCWMVAKDDDHYFNLHHYKHEIEVIGSTRENPELLCAKK